MLGRPFFVGFNRVIGQDTYFYPPHFYYLFLVGTTHLYMQLLKT